jgi:DNA-binding MarR family transcriptional regulator
MNTFSPELQLFLSIAKIQTLMSRKFDSALSGLSEDEFILLSLLYAAPDKRMRRIDLVNSSGFTLAWLTRLFLPMEKLWLVSREESKKDARMSYIILAVGGERKLEWAIEKAEKLISWILSEENKWETEKLLASLKKLEKTI